MTFFNRRVAARATGQRGAFSRRQARNDGMSNLQLRRRVQSGILDQVGRNGFRSALSRPSDLAELTSHVLDVGEPCWVSGTSAAALHGFDGFRLSHPYHLTISRDRKVTRCALVIHTSIDLPKIDQRRVDGLPVTSPARTLIDLARSTDPERLTAALDSGLRDGGFSEDYLHRRIAPLRGKGRYGIPRLLDVIAGSEVTRGGHSWLEREFLRITAAAGLPVPITQQVLSRTGDRLIRVDCRYPGTHVVVELLGYRFHRTTGQMANDAARANALTLDGFAPYQFTYSQVVDDPAYIVATVRQALRRSV